MPSEKDKKESLSNQLSVPHNKGFKIEKSIIVHRPVEELYRFWRNFENLPRFMNHLKSVRIIDNTHSHWVVKGPLGKDVEWDAEIINEIPNNTIGWRSVNGADVDNAGSVHFESLASSNGTNVRVVLKYAPPAGAVGVLVAAIFGENPEQQLNDDLNRFKQVMETGQVSSTKK